MDWGVCVCICMCGWGVLQVGEVGVGGWCMYVRARARNAKRHFINTTPHHTPHRQAQLTRGGAGGGSVPSVVEEALLLTNKAGRPKGMAVVRFVSREACQRALGG